MTEVNKSQPEQWTIPASFKATEDPLLDCLVLLSEYYGNPCSADALTVGLPLSDAWLTAELLPQAADRAGLSAKLIRKELNDISSLLMPCILLLKDKRACLLRKIDHDMQIAIIQLPDNGGESELSIEELSQLFVGYVFLIKKQYRGDQSLDLYQHEQQGHWLWSIIKNAAPIYKDALIASILVNLFALISPLFMMNIYDKILPNLAYESLWVLASGAAIAFTFDFIMRHMRSYLIDIAGKKIDIVVSSKLFAKVMGLPLEKRASSIGGMARQLGEFDSIRDMLTSATITTLVDLPFAIFSSQLFILLPVILR